MRKPWFKVLRLLIFVIAILISGSSIAFTREKGDWADYVYADVLRHIDAGENALIIAAGNWTITGSVGHLEAVLSTADLQSFFAEHRVKGFVYNVTTNPTEASKHLKSTYGLKDPVLFPMVIVVGADDSDLGHIKKRVKEAKHFTFTIVSRVLFSKNLEEN